MIKENKRMYKIFLKEIKKADTIVVYRHEMPDFDALGCQFGLATWLMNSFPNKKIYVTGSNHVTFTPRLYPEIEVIKDEDYPTDFLAIVCDTATEKRVDDKRFKNAKMILKFDHHPDVDKYANYSIVNEELASCAELISDFIFFFNKKYPMSRVAAKYLYSAIVGDSGRFLFSSVTSGTFKTSARLLETGIDISKDVYLKMYQKTYHDLEIMKYVLNSCVFLKTGIAYYILKQEDLDKLNITVERGKENLSLMRDLDDIEVWMSITENKEKNEFKVSIRSKRIAINKVASSYRGGGHDLASGATINSLDELPALIKDLEDLVKEELAKIKAL